MMLFEGWHFRSSHPTFEEGEEVELYSTGYDPERGALIARVGDTIIRLENEPEDYVDRLLRVRITEFNQGGTSKADLLEVYEEKGF